MCGKAYPSIIVHSSASPTRQRPRQANEGGNRSRDDRMDNSGSESSRWRYMPPRSREYDGAANGRSRLGSRYRRWLVSSGSKSHNSALEVNEWSGPQRLRWSTASGTRGSKRGGSRLTRTQRQLPWLAGH